MHSVPDDLLLKHHVLVESDNPFQQRARLLQALWREERGLPIGERRPRIPLGSRLPKAFAIESGANLMTDATRDAARREVAAMHAGSGQKIDEDRLWANLLSSQPLAFNLFAELGEDVELAGRIFRRLWPDRVAAVSSIAFEYSPERSSPRYTDDRTAFDVFVEHTTPRGGRGFIGIEVKYHEALGDQPADHRPRYDEVTLAMSCYRQDALGRLRKKPIEQLWRDHMLCGSMLLDPGARWETGLYVFLYPHLNERCRDAVQGYRECLQDALSFDAVTLEDLVDAMGGETDASWVRDLRDRYLSWGKIDRLV